MDAVGRERLPGPPDARRERNDLAPGVERPGLEPGHGQQLADHPATGDPDCSAMIPSRRSGRSFCDLVGVGADARQRRLEVVTDAAEEVVLRGIELEELGVLGLDRGEQLGVADRDGDLARKEFEEVLVGASQARVAGRWPTSTPSSSSPA